MINIPLRQSKPLLAAHAVLPGVAAMALGILILFAVGVSRSAALHEAAHDTRHAFAFPCH